MQNQSGGKHNPGDKRKPGGKRNLQMTDENIQQFQTGMDRLFDLLSPTFGAVETSIFLRRGLALVGDPPIAPEDIAVTGRGVRMRGVKESFGKLTSSEYEEFVTDYLSSVIYIIRRLTGNILNDECFRVVEDTMGDSMEVTRRVFAFRVREEETLNVR